VDELSLLPFSFDNLQFSWPSDIKRINANIYVSPSVNLQEVLKNYNGDARFHQITWEKAIEAINSGNKEYFVGSPVPRFDLAIIGEMDEFDRIIRPHPSNANAIVRAKGAILYTNHVSAPKKTGVADVAIGTHLLDRGLQIWSSRCGDLRKAVKMWDSNKDIANKLEELTITHTFPLLKINDAFQVAKQSDKCIKVLVNTGTS
jgi:hypothetical protein